MDKKIKHISKYNYKNSTGWLVRITKNKKTYSKLFLVNTYSNTLDKAIVYRNNLYKQLYFREYTERKTKSSDPNKCGISYTRINNSGKGIKAFWPNKTTRGKVRSKWFSIKKYGLDRAIKLAKKKRREEIWNFLYPKKEVIKMKQIYSKEFTKLLRSKSKFIIYIYTQECVICKLIERKIEELPTKFPEIPFYKLEADDSVIKTFSIRYNILSVPALLYFDESLLVESFFGKDCVTELKKVIKYF